MEYRDAHDLVEPKPAHPLFHILKTLTDGTDVPHDGAGIRCAGKTRRKGYRVVSSWGNTVVHVGLDGRTDVLQDPGASSNSVQYVAEQFGYLFVFRDYSSPSVYQDGKLVKQFDHTYENFTCRGINTTPVAIYYTQASTKEIIKIDKKLTETVVPGTEGTSDFVVLKDERLFWITKSFKASCGDKFKELVPHFKRTKKDSGNMLMACLSNGNVLASFEGEEVIIISPELEIIDSVANPYEKSGSYHMRIARSIREGLDIAFLHVSMAIIGVAVRRNKIYLMKIVSIGHAIYSMSQLLDCWAICGESSFTICKLNL